MNINPGHEPGSSKLRPEIPGRFTYSTFENYEVKRLLSTSPKLIASANALIDRFLANMQEHEALQLQGYVDSTVVFEVTNCRDFIQRRTVRALVSFDIANCLNGSRSDKSALITMAAPEWMNFVRELTNIEPDEMCTD